MTQPEDMHVAPINDLREHDLASRDCWCKPSLLQEHPTHAVVVVHNSADGRELVEQHGAN